MGEQFAKAVSIILWLIAAVMAGMVLEHMTSKMLTAPKLTTPPSMWTDLESHDGVKTYLFHSPQGYDQAVFVSPTGAITAVRQ